MFLTYKKKTPFLSNKLQACRFQTRKMFINPYKWKAKLRCRDEQTTRNAIFNRAETRLKQNKVGPNLVFLYILVHSLEPLILHVLR